MEDLKNGSRSGFLTNPQLEMNQRKQQGSPLVRSTYTTPKAVSVQGPTCYYFHGKALQLSCNVTFPPKVIPKEVPGIEVLKMSRKGGEHRGRGASLTLNRARVFLYAAGRCKA